MTKLICIAVLVCVAGCADAPSAPKKVVPCSPATAHTVDTLKPSGIIIAYCGGAKKA